MTGSKQAKRKPFAPDSALVASVHPAVNVEPRRTRAKPSLLILHYTGMSSAEKAVQWLSCEESRVSCHYVIDTRGGITQLVPERLRAWHAGVSYWRGETDINSHSIGIEIHNPGHQDGYPDFPPAQMRAVSALAADITRRHRMATDGVLAHSDVAPGRKVDPGEKFNWAFLARAGIGHWVRPAPARADEPGLEIGAEGPRVRRVQALLRSYGYDAPVSGVLDARTATIVRAFQLHFRPRRPDGRLDVSTERTLERLVRSAGRDMSGASA